MGRTVHMNFLLPYKLQENYEEAFNLLKKHTPQHLDHTLTTLLISRRGAKYSKEMFYIGWRFFTTMLFPLYSINDEIFLKVSKDTNNQRAQPNSKYVTFCLRSKSKSGITINLILKLLVSVRWKNLI